MTTGPGFKKVNFAHSIFAVLITMAFLMIPLPLSAADSAEEQTKEYEMMAVDMRLAVVKGKAKVYTKDDTSSTLLGKISFGRKLTPVGSREGWYSVTYKEQTGYIRSDDVVAYNSKKKHIALTFDDGPGRTTTGKVLNALEKNGCRATFFLVGQNVGSKTASLIRRQKKLRCEIGNHSKTHPKLTGLSSARIRSQLSVTDQRIKKITGSRPALCRAPYGAYNKQVLKAMARPNIMWDVDTLDWKYRNTSRLIRVVKKSAKDGRIVLMHDIHSTTAAAVNKICINLKKAGYEMVTVTELAAISGKKMEAEKSYSSFK